MEKNLGINLGASSPGMSAADKEQLSNIALDVEQIKAVSITYSELKALRDASELVPGRQYRITDYHCTTTQADTMSADHQFDIIVIADTNSVLNENARACLHEGDTYFSSNGCKLESWQLKYCIDNDDTRFAWADTTNGKGVIFFMKDEWNNECPYDFKNIMFKRNVSLENGYPELDNENGEETWVFTFCANSYHIDNDEWSELKDGSLESPYGHESDEDSSTFHDNIIKEYRLLYDNEDEDYKKCGLIYLNNIVFFGFWDEIGSTNDEDYPYYIAYCCSSNTFGTNCYSNTFGYNCYSNTFGYNCYSNTFGDYCYSNTFGNSCSSNTFGDSCSSNTFGDYCYSNTFGNSCSSNTFGNNCYYNTFGDNCVYNNFGDNCPDNTFGTSSSVKNYVKNITIENGVFSTYINCDATTSISSFLQNVHVNSGLYNKTLTVVTAGNEFLTTFGSSNDTKIEV